ncbi:MAG: hypothetical protein ACE148_04595 [Vicinamibacterales bacterium]
MQKRSKRAPESGSCQFPSSDVGTVRMVRGILAYLNEHQGDRGQGVHSLLVAYVQAALQVLGDSPAEYVEANREALVTMLDQARLVISAGPARASDATRWTVH